MKRKLLSLIAAALAAFAIPTLALADQAPIGYLSYNVTDYSNSGTPLLAEFNVVNLTGPNSFDPDFPVATPLTISDETLLVTFSDGTTRTFGSSYFTVDFDGLSLDGTALSALDGNGQGGLNSAIGAVLTGTLSPDSITLTDGMQTRIDTSFSAALSDSAGFTDGDLAVINMTEIPEPSTWLLFGTGLAGLFLLRRRISARSIAAFATGTGSRAALAGGLALAAAAYPASALTLSSWVSPNSGAATSAVNLTGSGFPSGSIPAANVTVILAPACGSSGVTAHVNSVTTVIGSTDRIQFVLPASLSTSTYFVSISGTTSTGNAFSSSNCAKINVTGAMPVTTLSTNTVSFAPLAAGSSAPTQQVTLSNTGTGNLNVTGLTLSGTGANLFNETSNCGGTLTPGAYCTINVGFTPKLSGSYSAALTIADNDDSATHTVNISGSATSAPVTLTVVNSTDWKITNGALTVDYDPVGQNIWSVLFNGVQMADTTVFAKDGHYAGLYMDNVGLTASGCTSSYVHVAANGSVPEYVDLWTTCPSSSASPATYSLHYVIVSNDPGLHTYFTVNHSSTDIAGSLGQIQWVFRDSWTALTNTYEFNPGLNMPGPYIVPLPSNADINTPDLGRQVQNAVVDLHGFTDVPAGFTRGFYTKYDYAGYEYLHQAHGIYGSQYGVWGVFPSTETFNGGPTKQNLFPTGSLLTIDAFDSHFLPSIGVTLTAGTPLSRLWGPYYIRFNQLGTAYTTTGTTLTTPTDMYNDAVSAASTFSDFYNNEATLVSSGYIPTTSTTRGSVSIQVNNVVGKGSTPTQYAWAVLSDNATNYQLSMNGLQYWRDISSTGSATFDNVVPGTYRLSVYVLGQYGELRVDNINVTAGNTTVVPTKTFVPENFGTTIFTMGVPDRSSHEFMHGLDSNGHDLKNFYGAFNYWADFAATQGVPTYYATVVGSTPATNDTTEWPQTQWGKSGFDPGLFGGYFCNNSSDDTTDGYTCTIPSYVATLSGAKGTNGVTTVTPPAVIHFATPADFASYHYVTLSASLACQDGTFVVSLNRNSSYNESQPKSVETDCMVRSGLSGFTQTVVYQFPISQLNSTVGGDNTLSISASGIGDEYDSLRLELSNTNALPSNTGWYDYTLINAPGSIISANDAVPNP